MVLVALLACTTEEQMEKETYDDPFTWENATIYFMLTDRFLNGDSTNDLSYGRKQDGAYLRSFQGGDIRGVINKLEEGYFNDLGVTAIWMNPIIENIHGFTDEGTGKSYGFHGYWARDWTNLDANFGTLDDYKEMIDKAHERGIRVIMDVVINHTGPVTETDSQWPDAWVRTSPTCDYSNYDMTVNCTLVDNLPDILTDKEEAVELPQFLIEKWKKEGRLDQELAELDEFFNETGYPRAPRYYIIKWLVDYIRELGIDGFRVDTAKHTEAGIWSELFTEAVKAFREWKQNNPDKVLDDNEFYMVGEVYNYSIYNKRGFNYDGDTLVDFYDQGFNSLINFSLKSEVVEKSHEDIFKAYSDLLNSPEMKGKSVLNYISSHDDHHPPVEFRKQPFKSAEILLLTPGATQIYYGDETARILDDPLADGDAKLRTMMNWDELESNVQREGYTIQEVHDYWQLLGQFRRHHPSIGGGVHEQINAQPYAFTRTLKSEALSDTVLIVLAQTANDLDVAGVFANGGKVRNFSTGEEVEVRNRKVTFTKPSRILLIEEVE